MDIRKTLGNSPRDLLHVVFKRKTQMFLVFGAALLTAVLGLLVVKPKYEASSRLLIRVGRENVYVSPMTSGGTPNPSNPANPVVISLNPEEQINSEIEILTSTQLAREVVEHIGPGVLYPDMNDRTPGVLASFFGGGAPAESPTEAATMRLLDNLTVEPVKKSDVISVSFRHKDPSMAAAVVNQLVSRYLDRHVQVFKSPKAYEFFRDQSQLMKDKMKQAEDELLRFKEDHKVTSVQDQLPLLAKSTADLQAAFNQTVSQEAETEKRLRQIQDDLAHTPATITTDETVEHNPHAVSVLKERLVDLEIKEHDLLNKYADKNPLVQQVEKDLQTVRAELAKQEATRYGTTRWGPNPAYQTLQQSLVQTQADFAAVRARKDSQKAQLAEFQRQMAQFNPVQLEYNRRQQDVEAYQEKYRMYLTKFEDSRISEAMDRERITNVSVIEPAIRPVTPVSPKVPLILGLAVIFGASGAVGFALLCEHLDESMEKAEHVETLLQLPVLATVPDRRA